MHALLYFFVKKHIIFYRLYIKTKCVTLFGYRMYKWSVLTTFLISLVGLFGHICCRLLWLWEEGGAFIVLNLHFRIMCWDLWDDSAHITFKEQGTVESFVYTFYLTNATSYWFVLYLFLFRRDIQGFLLGRSPKLQPCLGLLWKLQSVFVPLIPGRWTWMRNASFTCKATLQVSSTLACVHGHMLSKLCMAWIVPVCTFVLACLVLDVWYTTQAHTWPSFSGLSWEQWNEQTEW